MRQLIRGPLAAAVLAGSAMLTVTPSVATATEPRVPVVDIRVGPSGFAAPAAQQAGTVRFRVTTSNPLTTVGLVRLHRGVPLEQVLGHIRKVFSDDRQVQTEAGRAIQRDMDQLGTAAVDPGLEVTFTAGLRPGRYYLIDYHRVFENTPGDWVRPLDVRSGSAPDDGTSSVPTVVLREPRFFAPGELRAGTPFRVVNLGDQPNEAVLMAVRPGTTREQLLAWFEAANNNDPEPPPYPFISGAIGMGPISPGYSSIVTTSLPAGNYALVTWFPDFDDATMLAAKGMVTLITLT